MKLTPFALVSLAAMAITSAQPYQGVFTLSNDPTNEVGVQKILGDGSLEFLKAYETGGIGLGSNPNGRWTGANSMNYHVWNDQQWLLVSNMGGPDFEASLSIFKIGADLTLERTDVVDALRSDTSTAWASSVAGYEDRACVFGGGTNVLLECFQISSDGKLTSEFFRDFNFTINSNVTLVGDSGSTSVQFSPDGTKMAVLSKGSVTDLFYDFEGNEFFPEVVHNATLDIYPVIDGGGSSRYGEPSTLEFDAYRRPYDLVWDPSSERLWTVGFPETPTGPAIITLYETGSDNSLSEGGIFETPGPSNACWIEYLSGYIYTSNFIQFNDLTNFPVELDGTVETDTVRTNSVAGTDPAALTGPFDFAFSGENANGQKFLYTELALSAQISAHEVNEDGSLTEIGRYLYGNNDTMAPWFNNAGIATTLSTQQELDALFASTSGAPLSKFMWLNFSLFWIASAVYMVMV